MTDFSASRLRRSGRNDERGRIGERRNVSRETIGAGRPLRFRLNRSRSGRAPPEPGAVLFAALVGVTLIGPLSVHLFFPALPFVRRAFAVEAGTAQLAFSLSMLAMAAGTLVYGALADRIGRLPTLIGGLALFSGGAAIGALAPSIELLIAGRVLQGLGAACGVVLARTMVSDVYGEDRLPQMIAYLTAAYVLGPMLAPAIGGGLADTLGWQSIMTVPAVFGLATILLAVIVIGETRPGAAPGPRTGLARGFARLLGRRRFVFHMLNPAFGSATFMSANAGAAYLMVETLGTSGTEYGLWFALGPVGFMLGNFLSGRASGRLSAAFLIVTGTAITLAGALALAAPAVGFGLSPAALFVPILILSVGQGLSMPQAQAAAMSTVPELTGTASGIVVFAQFLMSALLTQLVAAFHDGTPLPTVAVAVGAAAASLLFGLLSVRR